MGSDSWLDEVIGEEDNEMVFVGIDWGERRHAVCVLDGEGQVLAAEEVPATSAGSTTLLTLLGTFERTPSDVMIGIETDHGVVVAALQAAGYTIYALNPRAASHYRPRHGTSGKKSDGGDARMLAGAVRTDRHQLRPLGPPSAPVEALQVLTRAHQRLVWDRSRHLNQLRTALTAYYPGALEAFPELGRREALAVLAAAPTPEQGRRLTQQRLERLLRRAGRTRMITPTADAIRTALRTPQLAQQHTVSAAYGASVAALLALIATLETRITTLEAELTRQFQAHPDAEVISSLPGLGSLLGARVLAESGDDPHRFPDSKARKCYAGTAPVTRASGLSHHVMRRHATNIWLQTACLRWAFCSLTQSPGARRYYDQLRARGKTHQMALRALANRWVGILHGCLRHRTRYVELTAWPVLETRAEPAPSQDKSLKMTGRGHGSPSTLPASA